MLNFLISHLYQAEILGCVNIVVLSDHGICFRSFTENPLKLPQFFADFCYLTKLVT